MGKVKVKLNYKGFNELRTGPEMQAILKDHASNTLNHLPDIGYNAEVKAHKKRAVAYIYAASPEAMADNNKRNALLKALGGKG